MSTTNGRPPACSPPLPNFSAEEFPPLNKSKEPLNFMEPAFKRYLVIKHENTDQKMTDISPFKIERKMKKVLGKKHVCKLSSLRSGLLLVEVDQKQLYDRLMTTKKLDDIPVIIEEHTGLNTSKGIVFCDSEAIGKMSNDEIKSEMESQNVTEVYRVIQKREGEEDRETNMYILTFSTPTLPKEVKMGYIKLNVKLYIPNPRRCFNCQRYGHGKNTCTHETVCALCGESGHEYGAEVCSQQKKCYHCEQEHETTSKECPMWKLEKMILEDKIRNNITFGQARSRVYSSNTELAALIPRIKI